MTTESETEREQSPLAPTISPLSSADPNSLEILIRDRVDQVLNKKPLTLTDADIKIAIDYYRKARAKFLLEAETKAKPEAKSEAKTPKPTTSPKPKPKPVSVAQVLAEINHGDLI